MRKAVITGAGCPLNVVTDKIPDIPPEGALVKTLYAGVCHSDIHYIDDVIDVGRGQIFRHRDILGDKFIGVTLGHEISGIVVQLGSSSDRTDLQVGDNVCVYPWIGCQECDFCRHGRNNHCPNRMAGTLDIGQGPKYGGGYATHVIVPKVDYLVKVPEHIAMDVACMLPCSAATCFSSLRKATPAIENAVKTHGSASILIIGVGALGLWCINLARNIFFGKNVKVTAADISATKENPANNFGADEFIVLDKESIDVDKTAAMLTNRSENKFDGVVNFVGSSFSVEVGLKCLRNGGTEVLVGLLGEGEVGVSMNMMISNNISIVGNRTSTLPELRELTYAVEKQSLKYPFVKHFKLDEINDVIDCLREGRMEGRGIIKFD